MSTRTILTLLLLGNALMDVPLHAQVIDFEWARSASGTGADIGEKVATDGNGNVFVTGSFSSSSISFGSIVVTKEPGSSTSSAIFLAKYGPNGDALWAISAGGHEVDIANGIATDASGNVCIIGGFQSDSIRFGATTLHNTSTGSTEDVFVAKYDSNGNLLWARSDGGAGGTPRDVGNAIAVDGNGNVYACGYFRSASFTFGSLAPLTNAGQADAFIVKFDADGNALWARSEAGSNGGDGDFFTRIATDASDRIYAAGHYYGSSITIGGTTLTNVNDNDELFIAKYDSDGNPLWAQGAHGNGDDQIVGIATDQDGNLVATGWYQGFPITFGTNTLSNSGSKDIFIAKYAPDGALLWATRAGGAFSEESSAIATDGSGNIYLTGEFRSSSPSVQSRSVAR
ncbi:MAG: SBBP repeat-containing protein [Flavobacteriales bacterium]|nr:SBBP repeat-containing protein [Flavobacteriales bacterium]